MKRLRPVIVYIFAIVLFWIPANTFAGPPFLTDDPIPVDYHHWEFYTFAAGGKTANINSIAGPAIEINNGVAPNIQLHLVVPYQFVDQNGSSARGLGDIEAGVKYRFISETKSSPAVGIFPMAELPSGDSSKGLGNGRTWFKLPLWIQRDSGSWTSYGGGGYAFNSAPGQRNFGYGGLLVQKTLSLTLSLGTEIFFQGATAQGSASGPDVPGSRETAIVNIGGQYNFTPDFSLLFSGGHSIAGEGNSVFYIGLYRTWGPGAP